MKKSRRRLQTSKIKRFKELMAAEETLSQAISALLGGGSKDNAALAAASLAPIFMSGGITVWLIANIKSIWRKITSGVLSIISFMLVNQYEDGRGRGNILFQKQRVFNKTISRAKTVWSRMAEIDLSYERDENDANKTIVPYGTSLRVILGKLVLCTRTVSSSGQQIMTTTTLRVFFARKDKWISRFNKLLEDTMVEEDCIKHERQCIFVNRIDPESHIVSSLAHQKRSISSIFNDDNVHEKLLMQIQSFIASKDEYLAMDYPWKFCALLHGKPGCGKTSTILAIASALNRDVMYIDMKSTSASSLMSMMHNSDYFIYVFEDIDAACSTSNPVSSREDDSSHHHSRREDAKAGLSLADLLNVTDGLLSGFGAICIFTTNYVERLDPALIRPGRMNCVLEMKYLSSQTAERMVEKQLEHKPSFKLSDSICPAKLQQDLLGIKLGCLDEDETLKKYAARSLLA